MKIISTIIPRYFGSINDERPQIQRPRPFLDNLSLYRPMRSIMISHDRPWPLLWFSFAHPSFHATEGNEKNNGK